MDGTTDWGIVLGFGGIVVTVIVAAVTLFVQNRGLGARMATKNDLAAIRTENEKAHAGITENVKENRRQIQKLDETMRSVDRSLQFLSGRQHERDQHDREWAARLAAHDDAQSH